TGQPSRGGPGRTTPPGPATGKPATGKPATGKPATGKRPARPPAGKRPPGHPAGKRPTKPPARTGTAKPPVGKRPTAPPTRTGPSARGTGRTGRGPGPAGGMGQTRKIPRAVLGTGAIGGAEALRLESGGQVPSPPEVVIRGRRPDFSPDTYLKIYHPDVWRKLEEWVQEWLRSYHGRPGAEPIPKDLPAPWWMPQAVWDVLHPDTQKVLHADAFPFTPQSMLFRAIAQIITVGNFALLGKGGWQYPLSQVPGGALREFIGQTTYARPIVKDRNLNTLLTIGAAVGAATFTEWAAGKVSDKLLVPERYDKFLQQAEKLLPKDGRAMQSLRAWRGMDIRSGVLPLIIRVNASTQILGWVKDFLTARTAHVPKLI